MQTSNSNIFTSDETQPHSARIFTLFLA